MRAALSRDRTRARRGMSPRAAMVYTAVLGIFSALLGAHALGEGNYALPTAYDSLARTGVPVELQVTRCATGIDGNRGLQCVVRLSHAGETRDWTYPYEVSQFAPYTPGELVPALLDPEHPGTVYTVRNVYDRVGAGASSSNTAAGAFCAIFATALAGVFAYYRRLARRLRVGRLPG